MFPLFANHKRLCDTQWNLMEHQKPLSWHLSSQAVSQKRPQCQRSIASSLLAEKAPSVPSSHFHYLYITAQSLFWFVKSTKHSLTFPQRSPARTHPPMFLIKAPFQRVFALHKSRNRLTQGLQTTMQRLWNKLQ